VSHYACSFLDFALQLPKPDLITLDSPFLAEPPTTVSGTSSVAELDFQGVWDRLRDANLRGWCDSPIDVVVRRLQSIQKRMRVTAADQLPFQGMYLTRV
jgi:AP-4 complex subunit epsilon-1